MSLTNQTNKVRTAGNGIQTAFGFSFKIFHKNDLEVYKVVRSTDVPTLATVDVDYTVVIDTVTEGGTVTFAVAPTALQDAFIKRVLDYTQPTVIPTESNFPEKSLENEFDRRAMIEIQLKEEVDRSIKQSITGTDDLELPVAEASKYIGWNADADALENKSAPTAVDYSGNIDVGLDAAKAASPGQGDIYVATDTARLYLCFVAGTWSYSPSLNLPTINALLLENQASGPATTSTQLGLYVKTVTGVKELFYRAPSSGTEVQLTTNGALNVSASTITGEIRLWATDTAPSGWVKCDGSAISRATYATLFALIGTTYGVGDGSTTFNVPDCRDRFVMGVGTAVGAIAVTGGDLTSTGATIRSADASDSGATQPDGTDGSSESSNTHTHKYPKYISLNYIIKT